MIKKLMCWLGRVKPKQRTVLAQSEYWHEWYRFKVHKNNQIYLSWNGYEFPLELQEDGSTICKQKGIACYNKPYYWNWIEDDGRECKQAEF